MPIFIILSVTGLSMKTTRNETKFWLQLDTLIWENQEPEVDAGPYTYFEKERDNPLYDMLFEISF